MPIVVETPEIVDAEQVEADFFLSASHFCQLYGFTLDDSQINPCYPLNIVDAYSQLLAQYMDKVKDSKPHHLQIMQTSTSKATLATALAYDRPYFCYWTEVEPLYQALFPKTRMEVLLPARQESTDLALSMMAYLVNVVGIDFFSDNGTWSAEQMESLTEWEWDGEGGKQEVRQNKKYFNQIVKKGGRLRKLIDKPTTLASFKCRLESYDPQTREESLLCDTATRIYAMWLQFGETKLSDYTDHAKTFMEPSQEDLVDPQQYMQFIWSDSDILHEQMQQTMQYSFENAEAAIEPTAVQYFEKPQTRINHDLTFAYLLYDLLGDTNYALYHLIKPLKNKP